VFIGSEEVVSFDYRWSVLVLLVPARRFRRSPQDITGMKASTAGLKFFSRGICYFSISTKKRGMTGIIDLSRGSEMGTRKLSIVTPVYARRFYPDI